MNQESCSHLIKQSTNQVWPTGRKASLRTEFKVRLSRAKVMHTSKGRPKGAGASAPRSGQ
jgi:hypothetical protein